LQAFAAGEALYFGDLVVLQVHTRAAPCEINEDARCRGDLESVPTARCVASNMAKAQGAPSHL
jgi:hypothetical protein